MANRVEAIVKPELLSWARRSAGLDVDQAAKKIPVKPERLASWERGESRPTVKQLRKLGRVYRRPLAIFYLPEPPLDFHPMHDFRRLPGEVAGVQSPELCYEIRRALNRREIALELYEAALGPVTEFTLRAQLSVRRGRARIAGTEAGRALHAGGRASRGVVHCNRPGPHFSPDGLVGKAV